MAFNRKNKQPKNQEFGFIRNAIIYGFFAIGSIALHIWLFGIILIAITVFNIYMAWKHFGEPTPLNQKTMGLKQYLDKDYELEEVEFGNIETDNKAYNAQKKWNELEKARNARQGKIDAVLDSPPVAYESEGNENIEDFTDDEWSEEDD